MALKLSMLIVFSLAMVAIGIWCRRSATDVSGFVLGGRAVGPWMTAFAYGTSYFSAVIFVGYAGQFGWKFGIASTWIGLANCFLGSLLAWIVLGRRTRLMTQKMKCATMPQFFGERFGSPALKIAAAAIVFVFLIPYTASLYNGLSRLFRMAFGIDYTVCIIVMSVLTCAYVVLGGYMATAINDFVQGIIMLIGIVAVIAAVLNGQGGFTSALEKLSAVPAEVPGVFNSFFGPDPFSLFAVIILTSLGTWGLPQMVGKFYAIRDSRSIRTGTVVSTVFALIVAGGCYFLGGFGRLSDVDVATEGYDAVIPAMISTLSSLVLTSSSTLTLDLLKGSFVKNMREKRQLLTMRILVAVFVAISAGIAIFQYKSGGTVKFIAQMM
ncbi:MAG: sodium:solute symporter, partial [Clostridia bacterium]|nr:sodium:solute symporter [Clostridia bacterium]